MGVFKLPDLGEGLAEAQVLQWFVKVGDEVTLDQPVVEVETAKAAVEVPVPFAGIVRELHCAEGETLAVGAPLITIETADAAPTEGFQEPGVVTASSGSGNVLIGYGTPEEGPRRRRRHRGSVLKPDAAPVAPVATPAAGPTAPSAPATAAIALAPGVISPVVRRLARDAEVEHLAARPLGPRGDPRRRVFRALVQRQRQDGLARCDPGQPGLLRL